MKTKIKIMILILISLIIPVIGVEMIGFEQEFVIICAFFLVSYLIVSNIRMPLLKSLAEYALTILEQFKKHCMRQRSISLTKQNTIRNHLIDVIINTELSQMNQDPLSTIKVQSITNVQNASQPPLWKALDIKYAILKNNSFRFKPVVTKGASSSKRKQPLKELPKIPTTPLIKPTVTKPTITKKKKS